MSEFPRLKKIKTSVLSRTFTLAKIGAKSSLKYAATKLADKDMNSFYLQQSLLLTNELSQLKGSLLKAGQLLSVYGEHFFSEEVNSILKKLQSESSIVDWDVMKFELEKYLDPDLLDDLEIETTPIGTASMGQVHRAKIISTGENVVLKIQYPDIDKAIDSDLSALKRILSLSQLLPKNIDLTEIFVEIKAMLLQELDYQTEAELTKKYRDAIKTIDPNQELYVVPEVIARFTRKNVLCLSYVEGLRADHKLIGGLSQSRKNNLASNFLNLYFKEIFEWNLVQTDPHLGNYKIQIDSKEKDRIVLLDFGATKSFPKKFLNYYQNMIFGSVVQNESQFLFGAKGLGFISSDDSKEYVESFRSFCYNTVEPFWSYQDSRNSEERISKDGLYNWKETDLPKRVLKQAVHFKNFDLRSPPKDILFLDRKTAGVFTFLAVLGAQINGRSILNLYIKDFTNEKS